MLSSVARASLYWPGCSIGRGSVSGSGGGPCCGGGASESLVLVLDEDVDDVEEVVSSGSSLVALSLVFVLGMSSVGMVASGLSFRLMSVRCGWHTGGSKWCRHRFARLAAVDACLSPKKC